jgi:hypothetical protein
VSGRLESPPMRERRVLPFGVWTIDEKLPGGGLAVGALHEVAGRRQRCRRRRGGGVVCGWHRGTDERSDPVVRDAPGPVRRCAGTSGSRG